MHPRRTVRDLRVQRGKGVHVRSPAENVHGSRLGPRNSRGEGQKGGRGRRRHSRVRIENVERRRVDFVHPEPRVQVG